MSVGTNVLSLSERPISLILLNGPRRVGKDTLAKVLNDNVAPQGRVLALADPIKRAVNAAFGVPNLDNKWESTKDDPNDLFFGRTPREVWIDHAENWMRKNYGADIYVQILVNRLKLLKKRSPSTEIVIVSDVRKLLEIQGLAAAFDRTMVLEIHRSGCSWEGDIGEYPDPALHTVPVFKIFNVENDVNTYCKQARSLITLWLSEKDGLL